jgi:hypothetical protein
MTAVVVLRQFPIEMVGRVYTCVLTKIACPSVADLHRVRWNHTGPFERDPFRAICVQGWQSSKELEKPFSTQSGPLADRSHTRSCSLVCTCQHNPPPPSAPIAASARLPPSFGPTSLSPERRPLAHTHTRLLSGPCVIHPRIHLLGDP